MSCQTTICYPCEQQVPCDGCLHEHSTDCIQYLDIPLTNINVETGEYLTSILKKLNDYTFSESIFVPVTSDTIIGIGGGVNGHTPVYNVKLDPTDNAILSGPNGIKVSLSQILQGKVKVNASDTLDYLENQLAPGSDLNSIITVTPVSLGGLIYLVPSLNKTNLLNWIQSDLCNLVSGCLPGTTSTTSTTSTSTTSTSTTSTSSTSTTTTIPPNTFNITNLGGQGAFNISFRDQSSLINYVTNNTTGNNQAFNTTYVGTLNDSELVIQIGGNVPIGVNVKADGVVIYNNTMYLGSVTISNIDPRKDIEIILYPYAGTTTTTTTTSTSTSSTTTLQCVTYSITNSTGSTKSLEYTTCAGTNIVGSIANGTTVEICAQLGSVSVGLGVSVTQTFGTCNTTSTTTSPVCVTYSINNPQAPMGASIIYSYYDCTGAYISGSLNPQETIEVCAYQSSVVCPGGIVTQITTGCSTTTTTSTTTSTTSTSTTSTSTTSTTSTSTTSTSTTTSSTHLIYFGAKGGSTPPIESQILAGSTTFQNAYNDVNINWTPLTGVPQSCWFAIPDSLGGTSVKNFWYVDVLNNGAIGGGGDLFGAYTIVSVSGVNYKVYITNYDTQFTANCQLKNAP